MAKQDRVGMKAKESIHKYWLNEVETWTDYYKELIGENSVDNILLGKGQECYACGVTTKNLQRCHIVPHSCGGSTEYDNMFLMCEMCHQDNPDTIYADMFYKYVKGRESHLSRTFGAFHKLITDFALDATEEELSNLNVFTESSFKQQIQEYQNIPIESHSTGCYNHMSPATMATIAWKRATSGLPVPTSPQS